MAKVRSIPVRTFQMERESEAHCLPDNPYRERNHFRAKRQHQLRPHSAVKHR